MYSLFQVYQYIVWAGLFLALCIVFAHAPLFKIRTVTVSGGNITPSEHIHIATIKFLEGNIASLIPYDSMITLPTKSLIEKLEHTFPALDSIVLERRGFSNLQIQVTEHAQKRAYCTVSGCVALTNGNIPFTISDGMNIEKITGDVAEFTRRGATSTSVAVAFDTPLFKPLTTESLLYVHTFLQDKGFTITELQLHPLGFFDFFVHTAGGVPLQFRFRDDGKIQTQVFELELALAKGLQQKAEAGTVEYVISYIPQKVIYKNRN